MDPKVKTEGQKTRVTNVEYEWARVGIRER